MRSFDIINWPTRVCFGAGQVSRLPALMDDLGVGRALVVCGRTVASGELLSRVKDALGNRVVAVYCGAQRQTTLPTVLEGAKFAAQHRIDVLVSVGGGSTIDTAKCMALMLACEGDWNQYRIRYRETGSEDRRPLPACTLPHIAIPTTAGSASEIMPGAGCRDPDTRTKLLFRDQRLLPKVAVLDPEMATAAGPELTAAAGMTAVARCIEALYSKDRQPLSEGLALQGLRLLVRGLPASVARPTDLAARGECQVGCMLSGVAVDNAMASVVHAIGHVFAGRYGLQHGVAHAILLAPAVRLLLPLLGEETAHAVADALGADAAPAGAAAAAASAVTALLRSLPLPQRLREIGVAAADLPALAAQSLQDHMIEYSPRAVTQAELLALLEQAW